MSLGNVSFLFRAADGNNVSYLFNTQANAKITLTVIPEPGTTSLVLGVFAMVALRRRRRA